MRRVLLLVTLAACGRDGAPRRSPRPDAAPRPTRAFGGDFTVPVPDGWVIGDPEPPSPPPPGYVGLRAEHGTGTMRIYSMSDDPEPDPADPDACESSGRDVALGSEGRLVSAAIVHGPLGETCRIDVLYNHDLREAVGTILERGSSQWMAVCNFDPGDQAALAGCDVAIAGFRPDPS